MTLPEERITVASPAPVIAYASGETIGLVSGGVRVLLALIAGFHFLLAVPLVLWMFAGAASSISGAPFQITDVFWILAGTAITGADVAVGVWMFVRRRWTWRAAHVTLTVLCVLELLVFAGGAALCVAYKHAQGWDGIALAIGVVFVVVGTVLFWGHALSKLALLRANVRSAFGIVIPNSGSLHRTSLIVMMALFALVTVVGVVWFIVR